MAKSKTTSTKSKPKEQVDRINNLPDDVICHILSFLKMRKAITTSILSTRWRLIWTFVPTLDFEDNWSCFFNISFTFVLESILAQHDEPMMRLLSGCPILEELYYEEVKSNNSTSFKIYVPSLKKLHVKSHDKRVQIVTPSLEYLQVQETKLCGSLVDNLPNLQQAHVDIYFDGHEKECAQVFE
ncbi:putative FBD-associated F-box protein At5g56820, partial [Cajanus cajan]|uniref:putative FBD-associated F-box protein At5g56820 n=1 Tax=Cajanus cajan TaxID=3821 RepID=UPI00098DA1C0